VEGAAGRGGVYRLDGSYATDKGKLDISALGDGKDLYVRFGGLQQLGLLLGEGAAAYGINADSNPFQTLDGKWLVVPANVTESLLQSTGTNAPASQGLSEADQQKLVDLYRRHEFLRVHKALADETVDNTQSRHYQIAVDKDRLQAFLKAAQRDIKDLKLTDDQIDSIVGMEGLTEPFDLWISKSSGLVKQVAFAEGTGKDALQMKITFTSYGQPVKVDKPQDAQPLMDALTGSMMGNVPQ
jgi:hypothetical protein